MSYTEQLKEMELRRRQFVLTQATIEVYKCSALLLVLLFLFISSVFFGYYGFSHQILWMCCTCYSFAGSMCSSITSYYREVLAPMLKARKTIKLFKEVT